MGCGVHFELYHFLSCLTYQHNNGGYAFSYSAIFKKTACIKILLRGLSYIQAKVVKYIRIVCQNVEDVLLDMFVN